MERDIFRAIRTSAATALATFALIAPALLSACGGVLGIVLGVFMPWLISYFTEMATIVTLWSVLLAFGISAIIGLIFGFYPALRAANMDPITALRHE